MRRLWYIPGLLSLALLMPLCVWYLHRQGAWVQEHAITMTFPVPEDQRDQQALPEPLARFSESRALLTEFTCAGTGPEMNRTLEQFRSALRELESQEDTLRGIHVRFDADVKYATIIQALDICRTTVMAWELNDHDLRAIHYVEPEPGKDTTANAALVEVCGGAFFCGTRTPGPSSHQARLIATTTALAEVHLAIWALLACIGILGLRTAIRATRPT